MSRTPMKATENPYCGAVVIGLGVVMPHPKQPGKFVLPGGITCDRQTAEAALLAIDSAFNNCPMALPFIW